MEIQNTNAYAKTYTEILEIINFMGDRYRKKTPQKLLDFFEENKDKNYIYKINEINDDVTRNFSKETLGLLSLMEYKYWASDSEKELLKKSLIENEKKYQEELRKKYTPDNLFKREQRDGSFVKKNVIIEE